MASFSAFLIVPYALAFPGVFAPKGVVGGLQTTAHLYLLWHCGCGSYEGVVDTFVR